jgi:hypothetical protein
MKYNDKGNLVIETKDDLTEDILEGEYVEVGEYAVKHDITHYDIVFLRDGKHWKVGYNASYNYGIEFYSEVECQEIVEKQVTVSKWVPKGGK